jgi:type VII secretion protein EccCb
LTSAPSLDELLPGIVPDPVRGLHAAGHPALGALRVPVGVVDRPYEQSRELLVADLLGAEGHVGIAGAPQSGKSTLLRTLMLSLALTHTPRDVQFFCLDFGGGLVSTAGLPHVGSTGTRLDRDRVLRTVEEVAQLIEVREARFAELGLESMAGYRAARARGAFEDPFGDLFLVVDGWATLRQDFEDLEGRVNDIAARGLSFGVHVVAAAVRWSEFRPRLRDLFGTKLELRLGDPMESEIGSRPAGTVPQQPGRGLTKSGHHFLAALPRLDGAAGTEDLRARRACGCCRPGCRPGSCPRRPGICACAWAGTRSGWHRCGTTSNSPRTCWCSATTRPARRTRCGWRSGRSPTGTARPRPGSCWATPGAGCTSWCPRSTASATPSTPTPWPRSPGARRCR